MGGGGGTEKCIPSPLSPPPPPPISRFLVLKTLPIVQEYRKQSCRANFTNHGSRLYLVMHTGGQVSRSCSAVQLGLMKNSEKLTELIYALFIPTESNNNNKKTTLLSLHFYISLGSFYRECGRRKKQAGRFLLPCSGPMWQKSKLYAERRGMIQNYNHSEFRRFYHF